MMLAAVLAVGLLLLSPILTLVLQVLVGVVVYVAISVVAKFEPFLMLWGMVKKILKKA